MDRHDVCMLSSEVNWATIWTAASAIFTLIAAIIALWAMFRWKKQDELKAKMNFKMAISHYSYGLVVLPNKLDMPHVRQEATAKCNELHGYFFACVSAAVILEHLLNKEDEVLEAWLFIRDNHQKYFAGEIPKSELGEKCMVILNYPFVFK